MSDLISREDAIAASHRVVRPGDSDYRVGKSGFSNPVDAFEYAIRAMSAVEVGVKPGEIERAARQGGEQ